ncbi:hypothetical protein BDM02DRAFT_3266153 [Thelephora ganbajun]|uniref:Uncharacterized protein n=1 Tax=Thelephora ganbajun TaxID=370292 RepID=A0ACB6ZT15_THEGA|nr:hypothetical protein BDM02DRAFT_3266153 [Thelephora ganbajun]
MAAAAQTLAVSNAENWDEDFDFHRANSRVSSPKRVLKPNNMAENWDDDFVDQTRTSPRPIKKQQSVFHTSTFRGAPTENWDDDFEDNDHPVSRPSRLSTAPSHAENWDEEFAANEPLAENWDDEFGHSSDEDQADKEDRTVTARTRHFQPTHATPPPPVPPLPDDLRMHDPHFSPTDSIFSLPTTIGRPESSAGYSVTSIAALRPTGASRSGRRFADLPASTPTRERRRLRKKSRPPPMDGTVMELEDRSSPTPPEAYERVSTPEPLDAYPPDFNPQTPQHTNPPPAATNKTPLLSRIGSVKKWRPGRKRLSTDPKDVEDVRREHDTEVTPRPPSVLAKVQQTPSDGNGNGVLRVPGSVGRDELKSVEKLGLGPSPKHIKKRRPNREPSPSPFSTRPNSMMASSSSGSGGKPRHVSSTATFNSGNRSASASRTSFSASMEDLTHRMVRSVSRDRYKGKERERDDGTEGKTVFMGGIRRISFGNKSTEHPKPDRDKLTNTLIPKAKGKGSRHGRSNTISSIDTSRPPWIMESLASDSPPQLPAIPVLPLPLQLIPPFPTDPPPPPPPPSELPPKPPILLPAAELQPAKSLPRPSLDVRPSNSDAVPTLPPSRKSSEATNLLIKPTASPQQAASLGRSSQPPKRSESSPTDIDGKVHRRNSLSDLRIPARITQAQTGLRRDLTLVKEFAKNVEQLKELQGTYSSLILEIHTILHAESRPMTPAVPSRSTSPVNFFTPRRRSRSNATTMPPSAQIRTITTSMTELQSKFAITWECAELLIELGGGSTVPSRISKVQSKSSLASKVFPTSNSAPPEMMNSIGRRGRERAITLGGDEQKPAPPENEQKSNTMPATPRHSGDWSNTSGNNDLNSRQLLLLREMLNHPDADDNPQSVLERLRLLDSQVNRDWAWGGPMGSTITLPPSDGSSHNRHATTPNDRSPTKKRRTSRLGMSAVRDMLRSLKRSVTEANQHQHQHQQSPHPPSSESSFGLADRPAPRRRAKTSTGPQGSDLGRESPAPHSRRDPRSPYNTVSSGVHKSPRRPSLASIFRFAHKSKSNANSGNSTDRSSARKRPNAPSSSGTGSQATMEDEEWDRIDDSASDLDFHSPRSQRSTSGGTDNSSTLRAKRANQGQSKRSPYLTFQDNLPPEPFTPRRGGPPGPEASRSSIWEGTWSRGTKLSNVEEIAEGNTPVKRGPTKQPSRVFGLSPSPSLKRHLSDAKQPQQQQPARMNGKRLSGVPPVQGGGKTGSVRSTPPQWIEHAEGLPDPKLAMTPENIKPLLDSAREVLLRCTECVAEVRTLLDALEKIRS